MQTSATGPEYSFNPLDQEGCPSLVGDQALIAEAGIAGPELPHLICECLEDKLDGDNPVQAKHCFNNQHTMDPVSCAGIWHSPTEFGPAHSQQGKAVASHNPSPCCHGEGSVAAEGQKILKPTGQAMQKTDQENMELPSESLVKLEQGQGNKSCDAPIVEEHGEHGKTEVIAEEINECALEAGKGEGCTAMIGCKACIDSSTMAEHRCDDLQTQNGGSIRQQHASNIFMELGCATQLTTVLGQSSMSAMMKNKSSAESDYSCDFDCNGSHSTNLSNALESDIIQDITDFVDSQEHLQAKE